MAATIGAGQWELSIEDRQKVELALAQTQLQEYRDRAVTQLSGGERQRAFLALALAQDPKILLSTNPPLTWILHPVQIENSRFRKNYGSQPRWGL